MPQPRRPAPPSPPTQPAGSGGGTATAVGGAVTGVAGAAALATPAAAAIVAQAVTAAAAAKVTKELAEALYRFATKRGADADSFARRELAARYPDRPVREIREVVNREAEFEAAFRTKQRQRLLEALPRVLAGLDPADPDDLARRAAAVQAILDQEKRFTRLREEAMLTRTLAREEQRLLQETSPAGAFWHLSPFVREHTTDCLLMGNQFWPWEVLREFAPPLHHGCACMLYGLDEAIDERLMGPEHVPDPDDAILRYRGIRERLDDLEESVGTVIVAEGDFSEDGLDPLDWLDEAIRLLDESNLADHARSELERAGLFSKGSDYDGMLGPAVMDLVKAHEKAGHSGFSHALTMDLFKRVANFEPLTPLTDDPDEWVEHEIGPGDPRYPKGSMWQSKRNPSAFSPDGGKTYTLLDDRTPGGRKRNKTYRSESAKALKEAAAAEFPPTAERPHAYSNYGNPIGSPEYVAGLVKRGARRKRHRLRWEKGWVKGGQFKPERGGASDLATSRAKRGMQVARPKPPALNQRSRWQFIAGTYTKIPEARRWERTVNGVTYLSPPGSTNVYRDGELISTPETPALHRDARMRGRVLASPGTTQVPDATVAKLDEIRASKRQRIAEQIKAAAAKLEADEPPVKPGDGPEAFAALRDQGFQIDPRSGLYGGTTSFSHPSGATLKVRLDRRDYSVTEVDWSPRKGAPPPRKRSDGPPESWDAFAADAMGFAHDLGERYGVPVHLTDVRVSDKLDDHSGNHEWTGEVLLGRELPIDVEIAAQQRRKGKALDEFERRALYSTYWTAAHELAHAVNPISADDFEGGGARLEEALTEESAHVLAREWLGRHGLKDVLAWADANPEAIPVAGVYRHERGALASLLDHAGIAGPDERREAVMELKFRTPPGERMNHLALLVYDANQGEEGFGSLDAALDHVELSLDHSRDEVRPRGVLENRPRTVTYEPAAEPEPTMRLQPETSDEQPTPALADLAVAQAADRAPDEAFEAIALAGGTSLADVAALARAGDRDALWELEQRADDLGEDQRADLAAYVRRPLAAASLPIQSVAPDDVDDYLAGAAYGAVMHHGTDLDAARALMGGDTSRYDRGRKYRLYGTAFYSSDSLRSAKAAPRMRGEEGAVIDVAVRMNSPLLLDDQDEGPLGRIGAQASERFEVGSEDYADYVRTSLLALGFDGVVRRFPDGETWAVALDPERQIATVRAREVPGLREIAIPTTARDPGPDVAVGSPAIVEGRGRRDPRAPSFGTGAVFAADGDGDRLSLADRNLYRPRDGRAAFDLHEALRDLDEYAESGSMEPSALDLIADALPAPDRPAAREAVRQAVERHRSSSDPDADTAATEAMRALGWGGVDIRHLDAFFAPSVLYRDVRDEGTSSALASSNGGAVVRGRAGRWVWIRGTYRHVPLGSDYDEVADGVRFHSPDGGTDIYRWPAPGERPQWTDAYRGRAVLVSTPENGGGETLMRGEIIGFSGNLPRVRFLNGSERIIAGNEFVGVQVARPRWTDHPDVRRPPAGQSTRRRRRTADPPRPPRDVPPPRPFVRQREPAEQFGVSVGMLVRSTSASGFHGRVTRIEGDRAFIAGGEGESVVLGPLLEIGGAVDPAGEATNVAVGQRVRVHQADGRSMLGTVASVVDARNVMVELDNGELVPGPPISTSRIEVLADPPPRPDGAPLISVGDRGLLLVTRDDRDYADGAEIVPGVRFDASLSVAVTANKLPTIHVGPAFFRLRAAERDFELNRALGYGLWTAIENDDEALQELQGLWTDGRMSADVDGQRVHLDRFSLPTALATGYARISRPDWRDAGATYPDALRWVALQADRRGYPLPEGALDWARRREIGGPVDDDPAAEVARSLAGRSFDSVQADLQAAGWAFVYVGRRGSPQRVARRVVDGSIQHLEIDRDEDGDVTAARGFSHVRPEGDDEASALARSLVGMREPIAQRALERAGWDVAGSDYGLDNLRHVIYLNADGSRELRVALDPRQYRRGQTDDPRVREVYMGKPRSQTYAERARSIMYESPIDERLRGFPADSLLDNSSWKVIADGEGGDGRRWITLERVSGTQSDNPTVERARYRIEDGRIAQIGRPGSDETVGFGTDDEYQQQMAALRDEHRRRYRERQERIDAIAERIRAAVNENREPFRGDERYDEVNAALRILGYTYPSERALRDGGRSYTYKNHRLGNKIIVRANPPAADGSHLVRANSRVTRNQADLGRQRIEGRMPRTRPEVESDAFGFADELARRERSRSDYRSTRFAGPGDFNLENASDHGGLHFRHNGHIQLGRDVEPSLVRLREAIARGEQPTPQEMSLAYASYRVYAHEIIHSVYAGDLDYSSDTGGKGIEEALTEELAHIEGVRWLESHGLSQVGEWARQQRAAVPRGRSAVRGSIDSRVLGVYMQHRRNFRTVLERAGMIDDPALEDFFRELKFRKGGRERPRILAERIARREGSDDVAGITEWVRQTMRGENSSGNSFVAQFEPILGRVPPSDPPDEGDRRLAAEFPVGSRWRNVANDSLTLIAHDGGHVIMQFSSGHRRSFTAEQMRNMLTNGSLRRAGGASRRRVGDWVQVRPARGRGFRGRVIEVGTGDRDGQVHVRKIGRGEQVWVPADRATLVDRRGNPLPDGDPPPGDGPRPDPPPDGPRVREPRLGVDFALSGDGRSKLGVGARFIGTVSGQRGSITAIGSDGRTATIRRDDGTTYTGPSNQFTSIAVTDEGFELKVGDTVRDGDTVRAVEEIEWTDPQRPRAKLRGKGWVDARPLQPERPTIDFGGRAVRSTRRNVSVPVEVGMRLRLRDGTVAEVTGARLTNWPAGERQIVGKVGRRSNVAIDFSQVTGIAGEPPTAPVRYELDQAEAHQLAMSHYRRAASAKGKARRLAAGMNAQIADQIEDWWRAAGHPVRRGRAVIGDRTYPFDKVMAEAYGRIFESQDAEAALPAHVRAALLKPLADAGFPQPNWAERIRPLAPGEAPPGSMFAEAVLRHTWTGEFGRKGLRAEVTSVNSDGERSAEVRGRILNRNGTGVGTFTRTVNIDENGDPYVYHSYLSLQARAQGSGFASAFNRRAESIYRAKGVKYVKVGANIDVGGYAWAATGFDWNVGTSLTGDELRAALARRSRQMFDAAGGNLTYLERQQIEDRFVERGHRGPVPEGKIVHAWEFAALGGRPNRERGERSIGQRLLLNQSWSGIKFLVGERRSPLAG